MRGLFLLFGAAPVLPPVLERVGLSGIARVLDAWFALQCERDPARMLGVGAVCARCLGIYWGVGLAGAVGAPRWELRKLEWGLFGAAALMLADVLTEAMAWRGAAAAVRVGTGVTLGYAAGAVVLAVLRPRAS